jgi:cytochrome P450
VKKKVMTDTTQRPTAEFLLNDPAVAKNPGPFFEHLRSKCPVAHTDAHDGFWLVSRYADVYQAAMNTREFSSANGVTIPANPHPPSLCLEQDDPEHRIYRRPMQQWFSPGRMSDLEPRVRDMVIRLIDQVVDSGRGDIGAALAEPLPPMVIALLLGLPERDWRWFRERNHRVLELAATGDMAGSGEAVSELVGYLAGKLQERAETPADDILSEIVSINVDGVPIAPEEAVSIAFLILIAGHETTVGAIGGMLFHVARNAEIRDGILANMSLVDKAVEESLRLEPPLMGLGRTLTGDTTLAGVAMPAAARVMLMFGAANRDPAMFEAPEEFDIDRPKNRHLAFGVGIHRCVGAPLARLEMRVVLQEVLRRMPRLALESEDSAEVEYNFSRSFTNLPVTW